MSAFLSSLKRPDNATWTLKIHLLESRQVQSTLKGTSRSRRNIAGAKISNSAGQGIVGRPRTVEAKWTPVEKRETDLLGTWCNSTVSSARQVLPTWALVQYHQMFREKMESSFKCCMQHHNLLPSPST